MENLVNIKKAHEEQYYEKHLVKLTYFHFFLKAVSKALMLHQKVNASNSLLKNYKQFFYRANRE